MKRYTDTAELVIDMHEKGFTQDFQLIGNDLYWLDEDKQVNIGEFNIVEFHKIICVHGHYSRFIVMGIIALHYNIKGILLRRFKSHAMVLPPVINKKLNDLGLDGICWQRLFSYSSQFIHE